MSAFFAWTESFANGLVVPTPMLPATVAMDVAPATESVPLIVVVSVMESPSVVLFSTVNVEAVVVESVTVPVVVSELEKTSPSASIMNLTESLTAAAKRLLSTVADAGFMRKLEFAALEPLAPGSHEEKVWASVGRKAETRCPKKVDVAVVDVAT